MVGFFSALHGGPVLIVTFTWKFSIPARRDLAIDMASSCLELPLLSYKRKILKY